jgi:hypothetical protein
VFVTSTAGRMAIETVVRNVSRILPLVIVLAGCGKRNSTATPWAPPPAGSASLRQAGRSLLHRRHVHRSGHRASPERRPISALVQALRRHRTTVLPIEDVGHDVSGSRGRVQHDHRPLRLRSTTHPPRARTRFVRCPIPGGYRRGETVTRTRPCGPIARLRMTGRSGPLRTSVKRWRASSVPRTTFIS